MTKNKIHRNKLRLVLMTKGNIMDSFIASCFWGLISTAFFMYGKKMSDFYIMMLAGIIMISSYVCGALSMFLLNSACIIGFFYFRKKGYLM